MTAPAYILHKNDLPADVAFGDVLALDTELMGLNVFRDRLCLLQIYDGAGKVHIVQFDKGNYQAPNARKLLADKAKQKLFFFARGDMKWLGHYLGVIPENVYCLKIASRVARTYTQAHDLDDVAKQVLGIKISKEQQTSDWGAHDLTPAQLEYAANDVVHLHAMKDKLDRMLAKEAGRADVAAGLFHCLPAIVRADLAGWGNEDIFAHQVPRPA